MALKDITRQAVLAAIAEYDRLGQEAFLSRYGFDPARLYVLVHNGESYDSKAIVGVAHRFLEGEQPLPAGKFTGGREGVGPILRKLGFAFQVGDGVTSHRLQQLLATLNVDRPGGVPALYQPITLLWAFARARRGEDRLVTWRETEQQLTALFQRHGRTGKGGRVQYPIPALYRAGLWELDAPPEEVPTAHGSSVPKRWFDTRQPTGGLVQPVYDLVRESPTALTAAINVLVTKYFEDVDPTALLAALGLSEPVGVSPLEMNLEARAAAYKRLCAGADVYWQDRDSRRATRTSSVPLRSEDARRAVLLRSEGRCENPKCNGDIEDRTDKGQPILEIDHIHDLALGGDDNPAQMIALCPNCHAIKTLGQTREELKPMLLAAVRRRHEALIRASGYKAPQTGTHP